MCGISGIWNFGPPVDPVELRRFTLSLSHRGPDGSDILTLGDLGLGHTRLAILDLSERGSCPMRYSAPNGDVYRVTFNGEIYNFLELRTELSALGHRFNTETDTEVIAAAYAEWGPSSLLRFNGMWAFAIWSESSRSLFLARDRFGVKPLYYLAGNRLAFASELKAFLTLNDFSPEIDDEVVPIFLEHQRHDGRTDRSFLRGVKSLPGGCSLHVKSDGVGSVMRWWETAQHLPEIPSQYPAQVERFRELFFDAVRIRMRSDVPVGTCLSGGVDSSSVASTMAAIMRSTSHDLGRCQTDWQRSFIASFPGAANDELRYARVVSDAIGATPCIWNFDPDHAAEHVVDSLWSLDEPIAGYAVPVWCIYRELRNHRVIVSLDGHGADELLGGYSWYLDWLTKDVNANLYRDFHALLLPAILRNFDRSSSAHGIEVRMPFMDWRLVTFAFALSYQAKFGGGYTKRILRDAMVGIVPQQILTRRSKIGFNVPITDWFNSGLRPLIERVMNHPRWLESPYFDGPTLREQVSTMSRAQAWRLEHWDTAFQISKLVNLTIWQILFIDRERGVLE